IKAGRLRALVVTTARQLRHCRTCRSWPTFCPATRRAQHTVGAPRNTPVEIVDKLNKEINAGLADPRMHAQPADLGGTGFAGPPAGFRKTDRRGDPEMGQDGEILGSEAGTIESNLPNPYMLCGQFGIVQRL